VAFACQAKANLHPLAFYTIEFTSPRPCHAHASNVTSDVALQDFFLSWLLYFPDGPQIIRTPGLFEIGNAAVIKKCETSVIRAREEDQARSLTMCGK